jgi:hypothetical protein
MSQLRENWLAESGSFVILNNLYFNSPQREEIKPFKVRPFG